MQRRGNNGTRRYSRSMPTVGFAAGQPSPWGVAGLLSRCQLVAQQRNLFEAELVRLVPTGRNWSRWCSSACSGGDGRAGYGATATGQAPGTRARLGRRHRTGLVTDDGVAGSPPSANCFTLPDQSGGRRSVVALLHLILAQAGDCGRAAGNSLPYSSRCILPPPLAYRTFS